MWEVVGYVLLSAILVSILSGTPAVIVLIGLIKLGVCLSVSAVLALLATSLYSHRPWVDSSHLVFSQLIQEMDALFHARHRLKHLMVFLFAPEGWFVSWLFLKSKSRTTWKFASRTADTMPRLESSLYG